MESSGSRAPKDEDLALRHEVGQSLYLVSLFSATLGSVLGLGLLVVRVLG
jgi:hypothetical protein